MESKNSELQSQISTQSELILFEFPLNEILDTNLAKLEEWEGSIFKDALMKQADLSTRHTNEAVLSLDTVNASASLTSDGKIEDSDDLNDIINTVLSEPDYLISADKLSPIDITHIGVQINFDMNVSLQDQMVIKIIERISSESQKIQQLKDEQLSHELIDAEKEVTVDTDVYSATGSRATVTQVNNLLKQNPNHSVKIVGGGSLNITNDKIRKVKLVGWDFRKEASEKYSEELPNDDGPEEFIGSDALLLSNVEQLMETALRLNKNFIDTKAGKQYKGKLIKYAETMRAGKDLSTSSRSNLEKIQKELIKKIGRVEQISTESHMVQQLKDKKVDNLNVKYILVWIKIKPGLALTVESLDVILKIMTICSPLLSQEDSDVVKSVLSNNDFNSIEQQTLERFKEIQSKCNVRITFESSMSISNFIFGLPEENRYYIGRNNVISKLRENVISNKCHNQQISGMGGIGKTQLANHFARKMLQESYYKWVLWLNIGSFENTNNIKLQIEVIALNLGIDIKKTISSNLIKIIYYKLITKGRGLIVFDDVLDERQITDLLPDLSSNETVSVLVTTRNMKLGMIRANIIIDVFTAVEALSYIQKVIGSQIDFDKKEALYLADILGYYPLALSQALAYILENNITISSYIELFKEMKYRKILLESPPIGGTSTHSPVLHTVNLAIAQLKNKLSVKLLQPLSFVAAECPVDVEFLKFWINDDNIALYRAIDELLKYGLLQKCSNHNYVIIHSLVQTIIKLSFDNELINSTILDLATFLQQFIQQYLYLPLFQEKVSLLLPHIKQCIILLKSISESALHKTCGTELGKLQYVAGACYVLLGSYEDAKMMYEASKENFKETLGDIFNSIDPFITMNLGTIHLKLNEWQEAVKFYNISLASLIGINGEIHSDVARCLVNLGVATYLNGNFQSARLILLKALTVFKAILGDSHINLGLCLMNLGDISKFSNDPNALKYYTEALDIFTKIFQEDHEFIKRCKKRIEQIKLEDSSANVLSSPKIPSFIPILTETPLYRQQKTKFLESSGKSPVMEEGIHVRSLDGFEAVEHKYFGDRVLYDLFRSNKPEVIGILGELKSRNLLCEMRWKLPKTNLLLSSGDILKLAGDFYGSADEPICQGVDEQDRIQRFCKAYASLCQNPNPQEIDKLLKLLSTEEEIVRDQFKAGCSINIGQYSMHNNRKINYDKIKHCTFLPSTFLHLKYINQVLTNFDHFSNEALCAYRVGHLVASETCRVACEMENTQLKYEKLVTAITQELFACRYLVCLFYAGHMRTNRKAIYDYIQRDKVTIGKAYIAGLLSKEMHDEDNRHGLIVENRIGSKWKAYGDQCYYEEINTQNREQITNTLMAALNSIFDVFIGKENTYNVNDYIPQVSAENETSPLFKIDQDQVLVRKDISDVYSTEYVANWSPVQLLCKLKTNLFLSTNKSQQSREEFEQQLEKELSELVESDNLVLESDQETANCTIF